MGLANGFESALSEVKEQHLIELLGQLEDTAEDDHLAVVDVG